ncbi:MAG: NUDIX domain-containing protein [Succinivibrio sp.]
MNTDNNENSLFSPRFTLKDVTIHKKERLFKRFFAIDYYQVSYSQFSGKEGKILDREIFERDANAVCILAWDRKTDEVALIEQFRPGALNDRFSPWLIEIVAGIIDKGETPMQAALREVKEEIGLDLTEDRMKMILEEYPSPGGISEMCTLYVADADLSNLEKHGGLDIEGEDLRVFKANRHEAYEQIEKGRIRNAIAIIALQHLELKHKELAAYFEGRNS